MLSLDVHMAVQEHTRADWVLEAIESTEAAIARSPFPVQLHLIPGFPGSIGRSRHVGYSRGEAPYVTFVDEDDYLLPEAFEVVHEALQKRPAAVFCKELHLQNGIFSPGAQRHHLSIYDRRYIIDHRTSRLLSDYRQSQAVANEYVIDITTPVYVHRVYPTSTARLLRRQNPNELD